MAATYLDFRLECESKEIKKKFHLAKLRLNSRNLSFSFFGLNTVSGFEPPIDI